MGYEPSSSFHEQSAQCAFCRHNNPLAYLPVEAFTWPLTLNILVVDPHQDPMSFLLAILADKAATLVDAGSPVRKLEPSTC